MAPRVIALLAAYNEADVIAEVVGDLIAQGVSVYLIDHSSTDGTREAAAVHLGKGLLAIERFPDESGFPAELAAAFAWEAILERKEQLAQTLDGDWFLHTDADELRESPFPDQSLTDGIALVDRMGYNAIDFVVLNFVPTDDEFRPGLRLREHFAYYEPAQVFDRVQIKCWKKNPAVDLRSSGGHEARFAGRRVFPIRFLDRHYPIRSQAQGERKILVERKPRFLASERERGWHVQYDHITEGSAFVRETEGLHHFDPVLTRRILLAQSLSVEHESALAKERALRSEAEERQRREFDDQTRQLAAEHARERESAKSASEAEARRAAEAHEEALRRLTAELAESRSALAAEKAAAESALAEKRAELAEKNAALAEKSAALAEKSAALAERKAVLAARENELALLRRQADEERQSLQVALGLSDELRRDSQHAHALAEDARSRLERARHELDAERRRALRAEEERDALKQALLDHARDRDQRSAHLDAVSRELEAAHHDASAKNASLRDAEVRIDQIYASRTWRWSAPGRLVWSMIRRG